MRKLFVAALPLLAVSAGVVLAAEQNGATAPFEIVRSHTDIDVKSDGSYVEASEIAYRVLDSRGQKALQQTTLSYTEGLQSLEVDAAYTFKPNGEKIAVPQDQMLRGLGATSEPGFEDLRTITIIYPKLEVGDEIVLATLLSQKTPLFKDQFAARLDYGRSVKTEDAEITLTAPESGFPLKIDAVGLEGGQRESFAGKSRWVWRFNNPLPVTFSLDSVVATDGEPHVAVSSFPDYASVARAYGEHFDGKAAVTPDIQSLANQLTKGVASRSGQARAIYDWVSRNIAYVNIVLGAGGFTPHAATDVLRTRYGDCKDHVMLLGALLAAKGIESSPALISAGGPYVLSAVPSPFYFNHLITYVPEFRLFLDSTARFAPYGVLPSHDADRPVLLVPNGDLTATPRITAEGSIITASLSVTFDKDGTAHGTSSISATGDIAFGQRVLLDMIPPDREKELFRYALGPGSDATMDRGNLETLSDPLTFSFKYQVPAAAIFPGPGAVSRSLAFQPIPFAKLVAGSLPPSRSSPYACPSLSATETSTFAFPDNIQVTSVPRPASLHTQDVSLETHFTIKDAHTVLGVTNLRVDHARGFCTPEYYNGVRSSLAQMVASLSGQILYK